MATKKKGKQWPEWMKPGVRVIRGPDFLGTVRNMNLANLGTLSYVPKQVGNNKVHVVWDTGAERSYTSGFTGKYELRAVDTKQVGIEHKDKQCKGCNAKPIQGMRFHCPDLNIDLCTTCYMADKEDTSASFIRYDTSNDEHVNLPARANSSKVTLTGVFEKSKVIRGPHWCYPSKDGGALDEGTVMSFIPEKEGAIYGWVKVQWDIGNDVGEYRFGAHGFVDVIASRTVEGGQVYSDHLPLVGILMLKLGDKVIVNMTVAEFKRAQTDTGVPGGWKDEMRQCTSEVGTILELLSGGPLVRVQYTNSNTYVVTKAALYRINGFSHGCAVEIINDAKRLAALQKSNGPFKPEYCGQYGRVQTIRQDGVLKIIVNNESITINPTACEPVKNPKVAKKVPTLPKAKASRYDDEETDIPCVGGRVVGNDDETDCVGGRVKKQAEEVSNDIENIYAGLKRNPVNLDSAAKEMYDAFSKPDIAKVEELITNNKSLVGYKMDGKTIVHLTAYEGYKDLLSKILDAGGDAGAKDDEGDAPIHYAAYGSKPECMQVLLQNNADPDVKNNTGNTALYIAVNSGFDACVQKLIFHNADVTIKNNDGDNAMHDAIEQVDIDKTIVKAVLRAKTADFSVRNNKGFNVLQWAVFKNNTEAVKIILQQNCSVVEDTIVEGFTALHVAAANDYPEVASLLLDIGRAKPDSRDVHLRTPLHLAVIKGRKRTMEVLIEKKADVNATDAVGDTPLHLSQKKLPDPNMLRTRRTAGSQYDAEEISIQITYFLLEKGADITKKNNDGKTAMDYITDPKLKEMLQRATAAYQTSPVKTQAGVRLPMHWTPMEVTDLEIITLDLNNPAQKSEYTEVAKHFLETMNNYQIQFIKRVQNPLLWEHYTLKKRELEKKYGQGCANELHLYHGTKPDLVNIIARDNFDFRIAGSNVGALYGEGSYFAVTAKYSDLYAHQNEAGHKVMFVAKVITGKSAQGKPGLKRPPEIDPLDYKKGLYDCCVDNVLKPKIYCVFDMNLYYPEYIIEYN